MSGIRVVGAPPTAEEPAPVKTAPAPGSSGGDVPRKRWLTPMLAVVAVLGLIGTVVFAAAWSNAKHAEVSQTAVRQTSRDFLLALTTFDAKTVDADFTRIQGFATGDFAQQAQKFFGSDVRQAMQQVQASSRGQIRYLFVEDLHGDAASVYAVVDQTILNNKFTSPEADVLRIELTMQKMGGAWRISEVTVLQAPPVNVSPLTAPSASAPASTSGH